jgi:RNA polymerase sigma factor (sigma-70 family)
MSKVLKRLLKKFRKQDDEAIRILYEMFYQRVYRTAYYITKDHHLAQDILQETFIKAFNHMDQLEDGENVGAWLTTITSRTAIDYLRKQKRWNDMPADNVLLEKETAITLIISSSVKTEMEEGWLKEDLQCMIDKLSPNYRAVIILKYIHEFKDQEIAEILNESIGTVKSRIHRAKHKLKSLVLGSDALDGDAL